MKAMVAALDNFFIRLNNRSAFQVCTVLFIGVLLIFVVVVFLVHQPATTTALLAPPLRRCVATVFLHALATALLFDILSMIAPVIVALWGALYFAFHPSLAGWLLAAQPNQLFPHFFFLLVFIRFVLLAQQANDASHRPEQGPPSAAGYLVPIIMPFSLGTLAALPGILFVRRAVPTLSASERSVYTSLILFVAAMQLYASELVLLQRQLLPSTLFDFSVKLLGLTWVPAELLLVRGGLIVFWITSIALLWRRNNHQLTLTILALLLLAVSTPALLLADFAAHSYLASACFITLLTVLYEYYQSEDIKKMLNFFIIPLYASLAFTTYHLLRSLVS